MNPLEETALVTLIFTILFGVFSIYHLLIYLVLKHKILLYYSLLIFGLTVHWSLYFFIDRNSETLVSSIASNLSLITAMTTTVGMLLFTRSYLTISRQSSPKLNTVFSAFIAVALILGALHIVNFVIIKSDFLINALSLIAALLAFMAILLNITAGILLFNRHKLNKYYLYSSTPIFLAALLYIGTWLVMNSFTLDKTLILFITSMLVAFQLMLFSIIIGFKYKLIEEENLRMQIAQNQNLKVLVAERTKDLQQAKEALEINNKELKQVNSLKNKLFSLLTHDVRTPLQNVGNIIDLLNTDLEKDSKIALTNQLKIEISEKLEVINNLLQWSYKQLDGVAIEPVVCDLKLAFDKIKSEFLPVAEKKGIEIECTVNVPKLFIDSNMFHIMLRNLVSNAIKFSPQNNPVRLWSKKVGQQIQIGVQDFGKGINVQWYNELSNTVGPRTSLGTAGEQGTGFGLIITRDFVEMNNGTISFDSNNGQGTTVLLHFDG